MIGNKNKKQFSVLEYYIKVNAIITI